MSKKECSYPATLQAEVYANDPKPQFAEMVSPRYNPKAAGIGIALSGGGPRAFCCAHGQMAYYALNDFLGSVGAISCVSGGAWFGGLFSYATSAITDERMFGTVTTTAPGDLTLDMVERDIDRNCLLSVMPSVGDAEILEVLGELIVEHEIDAQAMLWDRFYGRLVNHFFCEPFGIGSTEQSYTLDGAIGGQGTSLPHIATYRLREGRPFFIANGTLLWPTGEGEFMRRFEFSSLYSGTAQEFPGAGAGGQDLGYGFVESFAFNSGAPASPPSGGIVSVKTPVQIPLLSDALGTSSAAFGAAVGKLDRRISENINPTYSYWSMKDIGKPDTTRTYEIVDGGNFENTGIVGLLMRGYYLSIAFVNSEYPFGSSGSGRYRGVDGAITRLFGYIPEGSSESQQGTQIFEKAEFEGKLLPGLVAAKKAGGIVYTMDTYTVVDDNAFGIDPGLYPNGALVCWVYNDLVQSWADALPIPVRNLLSSREFKNFPNLKTELQNPYQIIRYEPSQANLLANMWFNAINSDTGFRDGIERKLAGLGG